MIYYFASIIGDLKGLLPLESIGKAKNQHCHKTKEEAIIYMINPNFTYDSRQKEEAIKILPTKPMSAYLYRCELGRGDNLGYNNATLAKIIAKENIEDVREYFLEI